jgi:hypothetical protein
MFNTLLVINFTVFACIALLTGYTADSTTFIFLASASMFFIGVDNICNTIYKVMKK